MRAIQLSCLWIAGRDSQDSLHPPPDKYPNGVAGRGIIA